MESPDDLVKEFLVESYENLDRLDQEFVKLEKNPTDRETLSSIFRTIHTVKGTSGFFGFDKLGSVTHNGENLLSRLRDGEIALVPEITSALLSLVDAIRKMLCNIENTGNEGNDDYSKLVETLSRLNSSSSNANQIKAGSSNPAKPDTANADVHQPIAMAPISAPSTIPNQNSTTSEPKSATHDVDQPLPANSAVQLPPTIPALHADEKSGGLQEQSKSSGISESNIRVDVALLDKLMNLVGELVLARNQILQFTATQEDGSFVTASQQLNLITTELQEGVMKTRMQPIGNIWNKFPRVVRDLASTCGKQVRLEMEGAETELDKTIIEAIKDPLTHVVRNCVDHGIETSAVRVARGKPAEGRVFMRAFHEGGQVNIEISDDGSGIDSEKIKQKALQRGLITTEQASRMTERELIGIIFMPGFSTAEQITSVSGRGVGMDVVKTNIERIGGTVDIQTKAGIGSTLKIKIPLTLAIIPALIVTSGGDRFAIPQVSLLELVRLEKNEAREGLENIHGAPVYRLRGKLLPLVDLNRELNIKNEDESAQADSECTNIVVLRADERQFGLIVDKINDTEEIVVKPLGKQLKGISVFAGATIMGDGKVALILDVMGIAQRANVISGVKDRALNEQQVQIASENRETLLLFGVGREGRMAIPLSMVSRLEEFPFSKIEKTGDMEVVQYRGQIMPLARLSKLLQMEDSAIAQDTSDLLKVVVYSSQGRCLGLIVDKIIDIVEENLTVKCQSTRKGVRGSAVVQGRVTEFLDVENIISNFTASEATAVGV